MPVPPRPLHSDLGLAFSVAAARAHGHSASRLRARDLERPYRGVRRRATLPDVIDETEPFAADRNAQARVLRDAQAYFSVAPQHAFVAGRSAAASFALPCPTSRLLHIGVVAPARAPRRAGIHGSQFAPHLVSVRELDGLRVASPASIWAMLADELTHRQLVILGDAIVRIPRDERGRPRSEARLATPEQLAAAAMVPRRQHRGALLRGLEDIRVGSMSPLETDWRLDCAAAGLPEPTLDVEIRDGAGSLVGIGDAVYPEFRTIVEIEGDHHRTSRSQWQRDIEKHAAYVRLGYEVIRLISGQIRGRYAVAPGIVADALRRHGWQS